MAKILIFSNVYYPRLSSASRAIKEITDRLPEHEYYLITNKSEFSWDDEEKIGNINVRRIGHGKKKDKFLFPFRAISYAVRLHKNVKFDFVWSRPAFYSGFVALVLKYKQKIPYLLTLEFEDVGTEISNKTWFWSIFYKRIFREAKITQAISKYLAKRSRNFSNKNEIVLVPDGIDLQIFQNQITNFDKQRIRQELGINDEDLFLISRSATKQSTRDLVKAINWLVYKIGILAKLVILSDGQDEEKTKMIARMAGVEERIVFLEVVSDQELAKYLDVADLFVRPDTVPSLGQSFVQAMAMGTPIVATNVGGAVDFLKDGQTGFLCESSSPSSVAQAIEKYFKNKELQDLVRKNCKEFVRANYSWDRVADKMNLVFEKML